MAKLKIVLDTDIGDDIDDAFALGVALKCDVDVALVSTVFKNTVARAKQAKELINLSGLDIPVYAGERYPLNGKITPFPNDVGDLATILPCQYDDGMEKEIIGFNAPEEIIRLAKKYPHELVIVTVGPLTNLAKALALDPSIAPLINKIYDMGGNYAKVEPEWNVLCDVEAYDIVLRSGIPFYGVGLDMTFQCPLDGNLFARLRQSKDPITQKILVWFDRWMDYFHFEKSVLHDPLTMCSLINDNICQFSEKYVKVILDGEKRSAIEVSDESLPGFSKINVATAVNKNLFYEMIEELFFN